MPGDVNIQSRGDSAAIALHTCCGHALHCICTIAWTHITPVQDTMTDLLCESAKLDDWMKEVPSAGTPETFGADSPPKEEAGGWNILFRLLACSSSDLTAVRGPGHLMT